MIIYPDFAEGENMLRIRAIVSIVVMLSLIAITGGGLRGSVALAATTLAATRSFPSPDYNVQALAYGGAACGPQLPRSMTPLPPAVTAASSPR